MTALDCLGAQQARGTQPLRPLSTQPANHVVDEVAANYAAITHVGITTITWAVTFADSLENSGVPPQPCHHHGALSKLVPNCSK